MKVSFRVGDTEAWLGNNGITLQVYDNEGNHVGKLRIGQATVEYCKGRTRIGNGKKIGLRRLLNEIENL